jgi:SpoVK/Ycf46/Vps4 family AAA+-type ATPase
MSAEATPIAALVERGDTLLASALAAQLASASGPPDGWGGLRVSTEAALSSLLDWPDIHLARAAEMLADGDPAALIERFKLDPLDHALVLIALLPEFDARFERVFAFLEGDRLRSRPTLGTALRILLGPERLKDDSLARLSAGRPLVHLGLLESSGDTSAASAPLVPTRGLVQQLVSPRDRPQVTTVVVREVPGLGQRALARLHQAWAAAQDLDPPRLTIAGGSEVTRGRVAADLAATLGNSLVTAAADVTRTDAAAVRRDALLAGAILYCEESAELLEQHPGPGIVGVEVERAAVGPLAVLPKVGRAGRVRRWRDNLGSGELAEIATDRFNVGEAAADGIARTARALASAERRDVAMDDVVMAARSEAASGLIEFATQVEPRVGWDDLVLPAETVGQLRELCNRAKHSARVRDTWGYEARRVGRGVTALFAGASGTGKSMAAEVIAADLGLPLWRVNLARVLSKWVGESERNLDRVFAAAESAAAMLVFDEADALFGRRGEIRHGTDRYANAEVSFLLTRMEDYEGVAILTTNLRGNLDDAFIRRLAFTIAFPFPDATERERLWTQAWPSATPRDTSLNVRELAERFTLSGANIANAALAAAYAAAANGGVVLERHILDAIESELGKLGAPAEVAATDEWSPE